MPGPAPRPLLERIEVQPNGCWLWTGSLRGGYGQVRIGGRCYAAHRVFYEVFVGPIPEGLTLDHLCHGADPACLGGFSCPHRRCCNPGHLEPVTNLVNHQRGSQARAERCARGHEWTPENTYRWSSGRRRCRACNLESKRAAYRRRERY